jgi:hypothetical protein
LLAANEHHRKGDILAFNKAWFAIGGGDDFDKIKDYLQKNGYDAIEGKVIALLRQPKPLRYTIQFRLGDESAFEEVEMDISRIDNGDGIDDSADVQFVK